LAFHFKEGFVARSVKFRHQQEHTPPGMSYRFKGPKLSTRGLSTSSCK